MTPRRLLAVLAAVAAPLLVVPPAHAAGPPVTAPDAVTVYELNGAAVFPTKNDHDPDNDLLTVCRLGTEHYQGLDISFFGDEVDVLASPKAKPGVYTFTYYACDFQTLVPGTISVTVQKLPKIKVTPAGRGEIKVKNPFDFKVRFVYGSFSEEQPDGKVLINKGATVTIPVDRPVIDWIAFSRDNTVFCGTGAVKGIQVRAAARPTAGAHLPAKVADAWRSAAG